MELVGEPVVQVHAEVEGRLGYVEQQHGYKGEREREQPPAEEEIVQTQIVEKCVQRVGQRAAAGKTVPWADCPVLAGYDLGTYQTTVLGTTVTGSSAELVNGLFLGRRAFYEEAKKQKVAHAREGARRLWNILTEGATP